MFMERCATTDVSPVDIPIELIVAPFASKRELTSWSIAAIWDLLDTHDDNTNGRPSVPPTSLLNNLF